MADCVFSREKTPISFVISVCPYASARLPLDGFSWNLILRTFTKNLSRDSKFV
jgi:hypothetical protein